MREKISLKYPVIVEGKYDKITLSSLVDTTIITTDGFSIFNNKEKQSLLRRLCQGGVILLTDSDGGGKQIRSFISGILPKDKIFHLYIPQIEGKERRKAHSSKAGFLGVEGMEVDVILNLLAPFIADVKAAKSGKMITKVDFFQDKLTGFPNSSKRREALCRLANLPPDMTPNRLLEAMNLLFGYEEYKELLENIQE